MAKETITIIRCDLCGTEVGDGGEAAVLAWNGEGVELDLCGPDRARVNDQLQEWMAAGRRHPDTGTRGSRRRGQAATRRRAGKPTRSGKPAKKPRAAKKATAKKKATGKKVAKRRSTTNTAESEATKDRRPTTAAVRLWAKDQGIEVSDRGKIPNQLFDAYRQATT